MRKTIVIISALVILFLIPARFVSPVNAKGYVDPGIVKSNGSWASTSGMQPAFSPKWLRACDNAQVYGAPGREYKSTGFLAKDTRVLVSEVDSGWAYLYEQEGWIEIKLLCETWQPDGW